MVNNGFDPSDFEFEKPELDKTFTISHFGAFNKDRNPVSLWKVLGELAEKNSTFKKLLCIQLIGQTDDSIIQEIKKNNRNYNSGKYRHNPRAKPGDIKLSVREDNKQGRKGVFQLMLPLHKKPDMDEHRNLE